ncbi:hypothetical protein Hamer_G019399 [Homarus americanus]|uniref:Uncharacterized protein n=1 Tax=Homarus americanus TaxID=6706 RepID=A0A8J5JQT9_HOMAM|nr:hypothetical protein Hamer_G019399 [Homarus americanus]
MGCDGTLLDQRAVRVVAAVYGSHPLGNRSRVLYLLAQFTESGPVPSIGPRRPLSHGLLLACRAVFSDHYLMVYFWRVVRDRVPGPRLTAVHYAHRLVQNKCEEYLPPTWLVAPVTAGRTCSLAISAVQF